VAVAVLAVLLAVGLAFLLRSGPTPGVVGDGGTSVPASTPVRPTPTQGAAPTPEAASAEPTATGVVHEFSEPTGFTLPSGNIACLVLPDGARCDIAEKDWGDTEPGRPPDCEGAFGDALEVSGTDRGVFVCHGDTAFGSPSLPYGESIRVGDATCESRENGVECRMASTRHGFAMSRTRYTVF
jgi:hypothetical protein